jgi:hypothetical protein
MNTGTEWIDQARRLLDAVRGGAGDPAAAEGAPQEAHPSDCRWCPICQTAAVLRGERPEVTAALADVLTSAATALRAFAADAAATKSPEPEAAADPGDEPAGEPPAVQRIEIA